MSAAAVNAEGVVQYQNLRAGPSIDVYFARFINLTKRQVDVLWINYNGSPVRYATLGNKQWIDVNTFVGHYWLFRDSSNGLPLICLPQKSHIFIPPEPPADNRRLTRKVVPLTNPVLSLKKCCIEVLANICDSEEKIDNLELPRSLKTDLQNLKIQFDSYRQQRLTMTVNTTHQPADNNNDDSNE